MKFSLLAAEPLTDLETLELLRRSRFALPADLPGELDAERAPAAHAAWIAYLEQVANSPRWQSVAAMEECLTLLAQHFAQLSRKDLLLIANLAPRSLVELCSALHDYKTRFADDELAQMLECVVAFLVAPADAS